jgi:LPXTG-motif cell wall-anchored protein
MKKSSLALFLRSSLALLIVLLAAHSRAHAAYTGAPEIDPAMATGGLALLGGVILVVRGRRR